MSPPRPARPAPRGRRSRAAAAAPGGAARASAAAALAIGAAVGLPRGRRGAPDAFVSAPGRGARPLEAPEARQLPDARAAAAAPAVRGGAPQGPGAARQAAAALLAAVAGTGGAVGAGHRRGERRPRAGRGAAKSGGPVDWTGAATTWDEIQERSLAEVDLLNVHGVLTISSLSLFVYQMIRICVLHQAPTELEVWLTTAVYLPWIFVTWRDTEQLENHYRVTFYASCGWGFMSLCSLLSVFYEKKYPEFSFDVLALGNVVFALACLYFYSYHWGRMWRHFTQNRFRPFWIPGLLGLMCLHALTPADFARRLDDPKWWSTITQIYPDEWWWVADVRIIELFVTAAALWLIILHIQGVFTGMRNAAVVVVCTIFAPLVIMVLESTWVRASSWQHYLMNGPKYW